MHPPPPNTKKGYLCSFNLWICVLNTALYSLKETAVAVSKNAEFNKKSKYTKKIFL